MTSIKDIVAQSNLKSMQMEEFFQADVQGLVIRASGSLLTAQEPKMPLTLEYLLAEQF